MHLPGPSRYREVTPWDQTGPGLKLPSALPPKRSCLDKDEACLEDNLQTYNMKYPGSSLGSLFVVPKRRNPKEKRVLSLGALKLGTNTQKAVCGRPSGGTQLQHHNYQGVQFRKSDKHRSYSRPPATGTAATSAPATDTVVEPGSQPVPVSVAPIHKKKSWRASSLELEGKEAKQLGSLSREGGIDNVIGKGAQALSLWRQLLSGMKERYPFKEDVICHPGKWTTMERGIQYLRELAVLEVIYDDLDNKQLSKDPDEVRCT
ncbi:hypothetical protein QYF61_012754 [Mycteria americana]|uniref:Uncharacterized protein n=1 Tax=Mycteria americana TaxID=33587 RepID=A0AAN7PQR9_MYCAM|nr:hypothetical protein QYF61_012754 [Mycteria americana]